MKTFIRFRMAAALLAGIILLFAADSPAPGAPSSSDILRMIQESPHFSDHGDADGVVWLRESEYTLKADGSMVRLTDLVVLARKDIGEEWTRWSFPIPEGGAAKVLSASLYDPGSGRLLSPVLPRTGEHEGALFTEALFPDLQEEFIIALSVEEILPKMFAVEDFLWVNETLPLWEQKVTVNVPAGMELFVESRGAGEPRRARTADGEQYVWNIVNSSAWTGRTLKSDDRGYISFSTRRGAEPLARKLSALEGMLVPEPPGAVKRILSQSSPLKAGQGAIDWITRAPSLPEHFPSNFVRNNIPSEGPWSDWEKTLLLYRWIRSAGWESRLHWLTAHPFGEELPAPAGAVVRPVLELSAPGVSTFFCDPGRAGSPNETPPSLWGKHIVTLSGTSLAGRTVSGSTASEHRLSIEWSLALDKGGLADSGLDVYVRSGWVNFFFPSGKPDDESVRRMVSELFPRIRFNREEQSHTPIKYGWKISLRAEPRQSIVSGGAMLVPLPGATPSWIEELSRPQEGYSLKFPFVIEQNFALKMPPRSEVVMPPQTAARDLERVKYSESAYHNKRRNTLTTGTKIIVSTDRAADLVSRGLAEAARRWMDYASKTIPLRVKQ